MAISIQKKKIVSAGLPIGALSTFNSIDAIITKENGEEWLRSGLTINEDPNYYYTNQNIANPGGNNYAWCWDGTNWWGCVSNIIYQYDEDFIKTGYSIDVSSLDASAIGKLCWDGTHLWYCNTSISSNNVYQVDTTTGLTGIFLNCAAIGLEAPIGITFDGTYYWIIAQDPSYKKLYRFESNYIRSGASYDITVGQAGTNYDVLWDGTYLWINVSGVLYAYTLSGIYTGKTVTAITQLTLGHWAWGYKDNSFYISINSGSIYVYRRDTIVSGDYPLAYQRPTLNVVSSHGVVAAQRMAKNDTHFFITSSITDFIYKYDLEWNLVASWNIAGSSGSVNGIAIVNDEIIFSDKVNASTEARFFKYSLTGTYIIAQFIGVGNTSAQCAPLWYDGEFLWGFHISTREIFKFNPDLTYTNQSVVLENGISPLSIDSYNGFFWILANNFDGFTISLFQFTYSGKYTGVNFGELNPIIGTAGTVRSLCMEGNRVWTQFQSANTILELVHASVVGIPTAKVDPNSNLPYYVRIK